ncbi:autotransporter family protein [Paraburkholderia graminis]|uniref:autotransporter family protein n=1 Tax=Paraburkholderia graminis TaxID=60548 RepID=UPI0027912CDA|nr:autotransporter outer membrane beta-barrel domain-containing protein [Paraburkholderia graminis]MDQ0621961.1 outer membrane autotransporter protein [Paraburkholderia graminis]
MKYQAQEIDFRKLRSAVVATARTSAARRSCKNGGPLNCRVSCHSTGRALFALSTLALAVGGTLPQQAWALDITVNSEAELRAAIGQANASIDASSTILLGSSFQVGNTALPAPAKALTVDTRGFTLSGTSGGGNTRWSGSTATLTLAGTIVGGASSGAGGRGGIGAGLTGGLFVNSGTIAGGDALAGGISGSAVQLRNGATLTNNGTIQGGNANGAGAGAGVAVDVGGLGAATTLINNGTIRGGTDLTGANVGAVALITRTGALPVVNTGTIAGGNGAAAIQANSGNISLMNSGTIRAGSSQANALQFATGNTGTATLELRAGSLIVGNVVANAASTGNTLRLGGTANDVFDISAIGATAQYQNFNIFEKTGASTWALTGTGTTATPWSIQQGTLQIGNGGTSGSIVGDVTNDGTLAFDRSDSFRFDGVVSGTGSVNQVGTGTTVLTAANSYTGATNVMAGTLAVGDETHAGASAGAGLTSVAAGASLGGYGTVSGSVNNSGTVAAANALASFASGNTGTFRIGGELTNAGIVNLAAASGRIGNVLSVGGNYTGTNGQVVLNTLLNEGGAASQSDRLVVGGNASGTTAIKVNQSGTGALTTGDGIQVVQVNGTSAANSFHLAGPVQAGAYQYMLFQGGATDTSDWYLRSQFVAPTAPADAGDPATPPASSGPATSPPASTAPAAPGPVAYRPAVVGYSLTPLLNADYGFTLLGRLHERVGDVASSQAVQPAHSNGMWGRIGGQNLDADAGHRFSADERTFFAQFGKDWTLSRAANRGTTHAGATLTFGSTSASFSDSARSIAGLGESTGIVETQAQSIGGYWTRYLPDGSYFDGVGQLTHYQNRYGDIFGESASQHGFGAGVSGEIGKPFALGSTGVAIEPQAQLLYQYLHLNRFNDGVSPVSSSTTNGLRGRVGFRAFTANLGNDTRTSSVTPYFTADVLHDFFSPGHVAVGGTTLDNQLGKTWYDIGIGLTGELGKRSELYANVKYEHSIGGEYRRNVFGQVGYRLSW